MINGLSCFFASRRDNDNSTDHHYRFVYGDTRMIKLFRTVEKIENVLHLWSSRKGKITVVQSLIIPQILYPCLVIYTPESAINKLHDLIARFVWKSKKPKVKHTNTIGSVNESGLNPPDV